MSTLVRWATPLSPSGTQRQMVSERGWIALQPHSDSRRRPINVEGESQLTEPSIEIDARELRSDEPGERTR